MMRPQERPLSLAAYRRRIRMVALATDPSLQKLSARAGAPYQSVWGNRLKLCPTRRMLTRLLAPSRCPLETFCSSDTVLIAWLRRYYPEQFPTLSDSP